MNESAPTAAKKVSKHRSPSYPSIDLKTAIDRARSFYHHEKRSSANVSVAVQHWNYQPSSGAGKQTLAALISYTLLEDKGSGNQRYVTLTDLALRILLDDRPDSIERAEAIQRAALMPKIHAELFSKWPNELPSNPTLRHYLLIEKKFNENSVDDFISQLRTTADFARIYSTPLGAPTPVPSIEDMQEEEQRVTPEPLIDRATSGMLLTSLDPSPLSSTTPRTERSVVGDSKRVRQDALSLDEGQVVLQWPDQLSERSFQDLSDRLELQLRRIKRNLQS